jgi:hypothetical protein
MFPTAVTFHSKLPFIQTTGWYSSVWYENMGSYYKLLQWEINWPTIANSCCHH